MSWFPWNRGEHEYELWLRNDLYTNKHTQWYYFRVKNTRANVTYRFTIVNTMKVTNDLLLAYIQYIQNKIRQTFSKLVQGLFSDVFSIRTKTKISQYIKVMEVLNKADVRMSL